jgi:multicomponent Na+:H+ antiporter subunit G
MLLVGAIISLIGAVFIFLGALGILRMPDLYNRMQTGTKATTLGSILTLSGIALGHPECTCGLKIIALIIFIVFTNPISSHALARAAHFAGIKLTEKSVEDKLAEDEADAKGEI